MPQIVAKLQGHKVIRVTSYSKHTTALVEPINAFGDHHQLRPRHAQHGQQRQILQYYIPCRRTESQCTPDNTGWTV